MVFQAAVFRQEEAGTARGRPKQSARKSRINTINTKTKEYRGVAQLVARLLWAGPASAASGGFSAAGPGAAVADFERLFREEGSGHRKRATKAERTKKPN